MLAIPPAIVRAYQEVAARNDVPAEQLSHYVRWLRFYLDFCHKYNHDPEVAESFGPFDDKLIEKHQEEWKRHQAREAVSLYHRLRDEGPVSAKNQASGRGSANRLEPSKDQSPHGSADNANGVNDDDGVRYARGASNAQKQPPDTSAIRSYKEMLERTDVPIGYRSHYLRWLRQYLVFCRERNLDAGGVASFDPFDAGLKEAGQADWKRKQAGQAVALFHSMHRSYQPDAASAVAGASPPLLVRNGHAAAPSGGSSWVWVFDGLKSAIAVRHYSRKTLQAYRSWVQRLQTFVHSKDPAGLDMEDVKAFLSALATERKVAASSQNQAFNALLFLFRHVLEKPFENVEGVVRAKRRRYIPVVLSRDEVDRVFGYLSNPYDLIGKLLYGCGLRLFECMKLRVQDVNFDMEILTIHDGKGQKDRTVPLPLALLPELQGQLETVIRIHQQDVKAGYAGTFLPTAVEQKYKNAPRELVWQWYFPASALTRMPGSDEQRRYHLHESAVQKAIKAAVAKAQIPKRISAHSFRHSFASHLLQANYATASGCGWIT